jgi:phosphatidylglycerophosphate synthase
MAMLLKPDQEKKLGEAYFHENTVADKSLTFFLQPVLDKISLSLPRWLSPNTITISAGVLIVSVTSLVLLHLPKLYGPVSPWVCIAGIVGVLGFVLLDNLDGRHAKNTGMCSKLGDFLDHGVDSLADPLAVLMIAIIAQGGYSIPLWLFLIGMILVCFMNYVYLWSDKHTKVCFVSDVQLEAYIFFSIIFALTAVFGSEIWIYNLRELLPLHLLPTDLEQMIPAEVPFNVFLITTALLLPLTEYYDSFTRVLKVTGSFEPFLELLPPTLVGVGLTVWGFLSPTQIFASQKLTTCLFTVVIYSLVTGRYNLARLTGEPVTLAWESYALLAVAVAVGVFRVDDSLILPAFFAVVTVATVYFYCATVIDMARILNVPVFGMKKAAAVKITPAKVVLTKAELAISSGEKRSTLKARNNGTIH